MINPTRNVSIFAVSALLLLQVLTTATVTVAFSPTFKCLNLKTYAASLPSALFAQKIGNNINDEGSGDKIENENIIAKTSWYAAEVFGKLFGSAPSTSTDGDNDDDDDVNNIDIDLSKPPASIKETLQRIKLDNDRFYFLSGQVDELSYDPQCYFADPFVGFKGTQRFVDNLQNLGSFITKYDVKLLDYKEGDGIDGDDSLQVQVQTKLMVKLELNLPWKPILAWPWGVKYDIDPETFLIVSHVESWDVDALEGVKQVFRKPTLKI